MTQQVQRGVHVGAAAGGCACRGGARPRSGFARPETGRSRWSRKREVGWLEAWKFEITLNHWDGLSDSLIGTNRKLPTVLSDLSQVMWAVGGKAGV